MSQGAHLTHRTARTRLTGERKRIVSGFADFSRQQMQIVDKVVYPGTAVVLVHAHTP